MRRDPWLLLLGKRIRELREQTGWSQENFAYEAGLDRSYYGGVERGERNLAVINLVIIAQTLGVEVGELFASTRQFGGPRARKPVKRQ